PGRAVARVEVFGDEVEREHGEAVLGPVGDEVQELVAGRIVQPREAAADEGHLDDGVNHQQPDARLERHRRRRVGARSQPQHHTVHVENHGLSYRSSRRPAHLGRQTDRNYLDRTHVGDGAASPLSNVAGHLSLCGHATRKRDFGVSRPPPSAGRREQGSPQSRTAIPPSPRSVWRLQKPVPCARNLRLLAECKNIDIV
ncbi:hypothetical protein CHU98_g11414, partial [Xylaria longipes]